MKKVFDKSWSRLVFILTIFSGNGLWAVPYGWVRDYNRSTHTVAVVVTQASAFLPGMTLHAFRGQKKVGTLAVRMAFHSKILGHLTSGDNILRGDMVLKNPADIGKFVKKALKKVSYQEIAAAGMSWIVKVNFSGTEKKIEPQIRKIAFSNTIGYQKNGQNYFETISIKEVQKITYTWDGYNLKGQSMQLKSGTQIACADIITPDATAKLKPPKEFLAQKVTLSVELAIAKGMLDIRPDALALDIKIDLPSLALGKWRYEKKFIHETGDHYFIKVYANSLFINDFLITENQLQNEILETKYFLQGTELFPGKNILEFYICQAEKIGNDFFDKGEASLIGQKEILYGNGLYSYQFQFLGQDGRLPLIK
jgi:hypothetical protein